MAKITRLLRRQHQRLATQTQRSELVQKLNSMQTVQEVLDCIEKNFDVIDGVDRDIQLRKAHTLICFWRLRSLSGQNYGRLSSHPSFMKLLDALNGLVLEGSLDARDLSMIMSALAHVTTLNSQSVKLMTSCSDELVCYMSFASTKDLARSAWAIAKTSINSSQIMSQIARESTEKIERYNPKDLCKLSRAYANLVVKDDELFSSVARHVQLKHNEFSAQAFSSLIWSFAKVRVASEDLFSIVEESVLGTPQAYKVQELSNIAWGFAKASAKALDLFEEIAHIVIAKAHDAQPQNIINLLWAFATTDTRSVKLLETLTQQGLCNIDILKPQELANLAWALAKLTVRSESVHRMAEEGIGMRQQRKVQSRTPTNVLGTCASICGDSGRIWQAIADKSFAILREFAPQELSTVAWAFATTNARRMDLFQALARIALSIRGDDSTPQRISNIAWSFAKLGIHDAPLFEHFRREAHVCLREFTPQNLTNLVWSFAAVSAHAKELLADAAEWTATRISVFKAQELSSMSWAFAKLIYSQQQVFEAIAGESRVKMQTFTMQNLSNLAWGFATAVADDAVLFNHIATEAVPNIAQSKLQEVNNLLWSFSSLNLPAPELFSTVGRTLVEYLPGIKDAYSPRIPTADLVELATTTIGIAWAFRFAGLLTSKVLGMISDVIEHIGHVLDVRHVEMFVKPRQLLDLKMDAGWPYVVKDFPDRLVIYKPPNWEVDYGHRLKMDDQSNGLFKLSDYLQSIGRWPILLDPDHDHGFLHRLDVPSSGLVVVAKSYKAYYDLKLQLNVGTLNRDYVVLCHGWVSPELREISARIFWIKDSGLPSQIRREGKLAKTCVKVLAHASRDDERISLLSIRIITGRQHQIRVHTAHVGHPTVCDGRYTESTAFLSDREWCPRNFLHRYRLALKDASGTIREVLSPLPPDLTNILRTLKPKDPESAKWLQHFAAGSSLSSWENHMVLGTREAAQAK